MPDMNEILNRVKKMNEQASANLTKSVQDSREIAQNMAEELEKRRENTRELPHSQPSRVEIQGRPAGADCAQEQIQAETEHRMAEYAAMNAEEMMGRLFGDEMGVLAAALETLAEQEGEDADGGDDNAEYGDFPPEKLCGLLEAEMETVRALPEHPPVSYGDSLEQWQRFGILLSGIVSRLNRHELSTLDVEEHIPVMEQQVATVVRNSWGIRGREGLLDMLCYLTKEGYRLRYRTYAWAEAPEELFEPDMDEGDRENTRNGWEFVRHFKEMYPAEFLLGWDIGRAAILTRWGCFLGWLTTGEAVGILSDLSGMAARGLGDWRDFGCSYQFGGVFWKIICGAGDGSSYLSSLTQAITDLLADTEDEYDGGQWRRYPWPALGGCE